ncbi:type II toxin-antitoxin system VapC family toxin [Candidatus Magnetominusculus dajiuhuensis]|uniref:type II toxin-antitoxin system VapC family toxin n=1 Tax=Candidatus Magnetominusculus dajiuhuensis TaxID=3137712 RepID=UPI003B42FDF3
MKLRYWDSCCCLRWLKKESGYEKCEGVIAKAEAGEIKIVTSVLTMAEVIYLRTEPKIDRRKSDEICSFFDNEYIVLINVDRHIAESSRNLLWDYGALRPNDAIHIASAIEAEIPIIDTFDKYLINLNGKIGKPPLIIGQPDIPFQEEIDFENGLLNI